MSDVVPSKGHRHTQSAATPPAAASSQNPQNPHYLNLQSHEQNAQSDMSDSYQSNPTTPPRTPRRADQSSQYKPANSVEQDKGSKQSLRTKKWPKNTAASPAVIRMGRNTPPVGGVRTAGMQSSAKPVSTPTAYAGATFHASPAPSALPIPSFYSRSVPDSPGVRGLKPKDALVSGSPSPSVIATNTPVQQKTLFQDDSPLSIFFNADREEKARAKSASSSQNTVAVAGPFNPPGQSSQHSQTPPVASTQNQARHGSKVSPGAIFAMELDGEGTAASPIGPAFSTPYAQRMSAARPQNPSPNPQAASDRSRALKAYLFSGPSLPSPSLAATPSATNAANARILPTSSQPFTDFLPQSRNAGYSQRLPHGNYALSHDQKQTGHVTRTSGRASGLRQEVTPSSTPTKAPDRNVGYAGSPTPSRTYGNGPPAELNDYPSRVNSGAATTASLRQVASGERNPEFLGMEESLRKILKLDPVGTSQSSGQIGSLPTASVSVPNYVGGRPPPMNGMHNGVMGS